MKNTRRKAHHGGYTPCGRRRTSAQRLTSSAASRRGVLLLVILGMLTLFLMIGTAFVVSSNQYRRSNKIQSKVGEQKNLQASQKGFLGEVINQLIRDTGNQNSALRYHSLLRDMYGTEGIVATIGNVDWARSVGNTDLRGDTNGQMIQFQITAAQDMFGNNVPISNLSTIDNAYSGRVATFISDPTITRTTLKGRSTRIVGSFRNGTATAAPTIIRVLSVPLANSAEITDPTLLNGSRILINGRPFNGTGVGYNSLAAATDPKLNATERVVLQGSPQEYSIALMPNAAFFEPSTLTNTWSVTSPTYFGITGTPTNIPLNVRQYDGIGGSDESYDAPDFQNMFLAWTSPNPQNTVLQNIADADPTNLGTMVLPSFHRPELINYWLAQMASGSTTLEMSPQMLRKIMLRPSWFDHPDFDGGLDNREYAQVAQGFNPQSPNPTQALNLVRRMIYGPWDVDNDNDGIRDSIWVDFGAPVMVGSNGRLVKPLAAIMVLDMDGRLNVNAHGTRELAGIGGQPNDVDFAGGVDSDDAPRGQGFGVAEIRLRDVVGQDYFRRLMEGVIAGNPVLPGSATGRVFAQEFPGKYGYRGVNQEPGRDNIFDLNAQLKMQGFPGPNALQRSNFGSLPDLRARYSLGLNDFGQAITDFPNSDYFRLVEDSPYELDISTTGARGTGTSVNIPYSLAEFERILRAFDLDSGTLPPRLYELAGEFRLPAPQEHETDIQRLNQWRTLLTTDSWDLPEPGVQLPSWVRVGPDGVAGTSTNLAAGYDDFANVMASGAGTRGGPVPRPPVNQTYADLIEFQLLLKIFNGSAPRALTPTEQSNLRRAMAMLIAPEMMAGLKLDLNRPLGNGRDDNGNGVVDEPGEDEGAFWAIDDSRLTANEAANTAKDQFRDNTLGLFRDDQDLNGDGTIDTNEQAFCNPTDEPGRVNLHNYRRQLLARHLYVLAMALADPLSTTATPEVVKSRSRQLAQWAINAVDFRDPDNIMTAFEYDNNPFDGWNPDGDISTTADWAGPDTNPGTADDTGGLVWGTEKPELLITETLAWHDRRTEDTRRDKPDSDETDSGKAGMTDDDKDEYDRGQDQRERPIGAAFVEIYNPSAPAPGANADTHFVDPAGNDLGVNLARTHDLSPTGSPVWRLAVYQTRLVANDLRRIIAGADKDPDDIDNQNIPSTLDRSVYFTGFDPGFGDDGVAFYNDATTNPTPSVRPGRYMVVGAGKSVGVGEYLAEFGAKTGERNSPRGIKLNTRNATNPAIAVQLLGADGTTVLDPAGFPVASPVESVMPPIPGDTSASMADVAIIDQPRRFTITEPASGYPDNWAGSRWDGRQYGPEFIDIPLDDHRSLVGGPGGGIGGGGGGRGGIGAPSDRKPNTYRDGETRLSLPGQAPSGGGIGGAAIQPPSDPEQARRTIPGFSWIYLQRLANPLLPWNPPAKLPNGTNNTNHNPSLAVNPYLTVDSMGANVTVFNGLRDSEGLRVTPDAEPLEFRNAFAKDAFASVQRGRVNVPSDPSLRLTDLQSRAAATRPGPNYAPIDPDTASSATRPPANLWNPEGIGITSNSGVMAGFYMNKAGNGFGAEPGPQGNSHNFNGIPDNTLGFLNEPFRGATNSQIQPDQPFPWIDWNNRPFANPGELMQVPAWRSSQLLQTFSFLNAAATSPLPNQELYSDTGGRKAKEVVLSNSLKWVLDGPYGHLLNFFRVDSKGDDNTAGTADDMGIAGLYRVLDFVAVPSLYVGSETWLNPATFGAELADDPITGAPNKTPRDPRYGLQPPFNRVASRREPGRVNLNTIARKERGASSRGGKDVWDGVMHGSAKPAGNNDNSHAGPDDDALFSIRRGYGTFGDDTVLLNAAYPTLIANPFRPAGTGDLVPLANMIREGTEATILRSMGESPFTNASAVPQTQPVGVPFLTTDTPEGFRNAARNPYFRYSPISRLSSMTTTRSNVFAVWVTIGFFEVEEVPQWTDTQDQRDRFGTVDVYNRVYPDGYTFGKEAGIETGDVERVREFAIIDRTIPVAFEPGANHNSQETIRLRRKIE